MTDRDINIRSVLFLVIGILLVLSLIICIYIVVNEKDLVKTEASVIEVNNDNEGTGKNSISVVYVVNGVTYEYNFRYKDEIKVNDKIIIYYHENSITSVQTYKTSKIIFICPVIGLVLCGIGIYDLFKKNKPQANAIKAPAKTEEPPVKAPPKVEAEPPIKEVPKTDLQLEPSIAVSAPKPSEAPRPVAPAAPVAPAPQPVQNQATQPKVPTGAPTPQPVQAQAPAPAQAPTNSVVTPDKLPVKKAEPAPLKEAAPLVEASNMKSLEEVTEKVRASVTKNINSDSTDDDIKNVIKEVLKEVIKEVKEEEKPETEVVQKRVIPNYFYISGTSLIYEEMGKKAQELNLKDIKRVVRTINSAGSVVKLVVSNDEYKIVLTNMKNIDLEQLANLLHNKMRTIDDTFKEIIERKEY